MGCIIKESYHKGSENFIEKPGIFRHQENYLYLLPWYFQAFKISAEVDQNDKLLKGKQNMAPRPKGCPGFV